MVPHKLLAEILKARRLSQSAAATEIGISRAELWFLLHGQRRASHVMAEMLEVWTNGRIPASSWLTPRQQLRVARVGHRAA